VREFGLELDSDGTYVFFARGVDRVAESFDDFVGTLPNTESAFDGGNALWSRFQDNLENFVNKAENGGSAAKINPTIARPDWDKVKAVLRGKKPTSDLGCD
jgi:hypothetical protein